MYQKVCKLIIRRIDISNYFLCRERVESTLDELMRELKNSGVGLFIYDFEIIGVVEKMIVNRFGAVRVNIPFDFSVIISSEEIDFSAGAKFKCLI